MRPMRGILLKIASVVVFIGMFSLVKYTAPRIPPGEAIFFRSFFAMPVIVVWLLSRREMAAGLRTANPLGHLWRGVVGTVGMGLVFAALALLPLPEATALGYTAPLLVVVFAAMFLGEQVRAFRIAAVMLGFVGVLIVLSPRLGATADGALGYREALGTMFALGGAVFAALAQVFIRKLVQTEKTAAIVFYFSLTATVLSLATLPFGWVMPTPTEAALLILAGLLGGVGQVLLTSSYREADASLIAPFEYTSMLLAIGIGYAVFDEVPTLTMLAGAALVVTAGLLIIWRERKLGIERARQRRAMTPQG
ncbi:MAG: DMT family transporter [Gemmobacter sp.]